MKIIKKPNKKGQTLGASEKTGKYILLALAFLLILYIILKVIIKRIREIYF